MLAGCTVLGIEEHTAIELTAERIDPGGQTWSDAQVEVVAKISCM